MGFNSFEVLIVKTVFVYPGQGSQAVGMGVAVAEAFPEAADIFRRASGLAGYDILQLCAEGPSDKLSRTLYTQPALFTVEAALTEILNHRGVRPAAVAGHSLGEYGAWYASGALGFEEGFTLVSERGRLMDGADPEGKGTMAAVIGLNEQEVRAVIESIPGIVVLANLNSPQQQVISGEREAVQQAGVLLKEKGAKRVLPLPVSGAFHSPLMEAAREAFSRAVDKVRVSDARIPVYSNVTARPVIAADEIRSLMVRQLTSPVRWTETIRNMASDGMGRAFEIGPGNVLAGLIKRIVESFEVVSAADPASIGEAANEQA